MSWNRRHFLGLAGAGAVALDRPRIARRGAAGFDGGVGEDRRRAGPQTGRNPNPGDYRLSRTVAPRGRVSRSCPLEGRRRGSFSDQWAGLPPSDPASPGHSLFSWEGCPRTGGAPVRGVPVSGQLQTAGAGVVESGGLGGTGHLGHAGADHAASRWANYWAASCGARFPSTWPAVAATRRRSRKWSICSA